MKGELALDNEFIKSIRDCILASAEGSVFASSDFAGTADSVQRVKQ